MPEIAPTVEAAVDAVRSGRATAVELVQRSLSAIEAANGALNAFVYVDGDRALEAASAIDRSVASGEPLGPLAGVPFGVKDLEDAAGMPTVRGSRWFTSVAPAARDDIHVARLRAAGAIPIGKTATPEFGSSAFTSSLVHGVTHNPWDLRRTPGGSSGGSAAAVSAGLVPFCTGSDGGGSIRGPAAFTGLPGLRPVYGRIPTFGVTHVAQNAVVFALATTVSDTALLLDVCAGPDARDRTCLPTAPYRYRAVLDDLPVDALRVAFSLDLGFIPVEPEVAAIVEDGFGELIRSAGLKAVATHIKLDDFSDIYFKIEGVDRWIDLPSSLWPERASDINPGIRPGWESGARATLPKLGAIYTARERLERQVAALFESFDVLITPSMSYSPFAADGPLPSQIDGRQVEQYTGVAFGFLASLCNLPAMSVPAGITAAGLPVGMQILAKQHSEHVCLRLARLFERIQPWPRHAPGWPGMGFA